MTDSLYRRPAGPLAHLITAAAFAATLHGACSAHAQTAAAAPADPVSLPEIEVVTKAPSSKSKQAAKPAKKVTAAEPQTVPLTRPREARGPAEGNAGTPAAGVGQIMGGSGNPGGQTATAIEGNRVKADPVFSAADLLRQAPGVSIKQGNGPRDVGISIRGSNARNGFAIRNIVIMEDGFPVTQPDGLSRSDLIDPHAYAGVDVWRGPSSALFGNYATGGALNFRMPRGGDIQGVEYGIDVGGDGYLNNYMLGGTKLGAYEGSVFLSDVRGDGHYDYSSFETQTVNALLTWQPNNDDKLTFKFINNELDTELPFRMSLNQFRTNPFQKGCDAVATAAPGCVTAGFSAVGGPAAGRPQQTAAQAGAGRDDRRTIFGARWEHRFQEDTQGRVQVVLDDRNISQPTGNTSSIGDFFSYNVSSDISHRKTFAGLPAVYSLATFWNHLPVDSDTFHVAFGGNARLGKLQSNSKGETTNFGMRYRQEVALSPAWSAVAGATIERTLLSGRSTSFTYTAGGALSATSIVNADREFTNAAPELSLLYRPSDAWQFRGRVGTGYGTPQFGNLFVTPSGAPGNNTDLEPQKNVGFDLGADWTPTRNISLSVTGFYEFFENELVSQSTGVVGQNFSFNAPKSEHRGIEAAADVTLLPGLKYSAAYIFNDQIYTEYRERLGGSALLFDRAGNKIPGVSPHEIVTRLGYDQPSGPLQGVGAFVEYQWHDGFYMENANLLEAPGYDVVTLNLHYKKTFERGPVRDLLAYVEVRNLFDETYISSANNIVDTPSSTAATLANSGTNSIYAGAPRTFYTGMKVKF